jgi:hypothetical protein
MTLYGVEEKGLYEKNLRSYAEVAARREKALSYLDEIEKRAGRLKGRLYPPSAQVLDEFIARFEKKEKSFTEYYDRLSSEARQAEINLLGYPHFLSLEELKKNEEKIDFTKANTEQIELFRALKDRGLAGAQTEAVSKANTGSRAASLFYQELLERAVSSGEDLSKYPQLAAYAAYLKQYAAMDLESLLLEAHRIEREVFEGLLVSGDAKSLFEATRVTRNLRTLLTLQATKDDFLDHQEQAADEHSRIVWMLAFINRKLMDAGNDADVLPYTPVLEDALPEIEDFYRTTEDRDRVMVRRALEKMEKENLKVAVLMTGGYHTPNLKELLRKENISYVVVSPNVKEETNLKRYEKLLLAQLKEKSSAKEQDVLANTDAKNMSLLLADARPGDIIKRIQNSLKDVSGLATQGVRHKTLAPARQSSGGGDSSHPADAGARLADIRTPDEEYMEFWFGYRPPDRSGEIFKSVITVVKEALGVLKADTSKLGRLETVKLKQTLESALSAAKSENKTDTRQHLSESLPWLKRLGPGWETKIAPLVNQLGSSGARLSGRQARLGRGEWGIFIHSLTMLLIVPMIGLALLAASAGCKVTYKTAPSGISGGRW